MGTSKSSTGPKSNVPYIPPWIKPDTPELQLAQSEKDSLETEQANLAWGISPQGRFATARRYLGEYAGTGKRENLRRALGSYSRKGMGGASNLASRMRISTTTGAALFNLLQEISKKNTPPLSEWVTQLTLRNLSVSEIADEIINQIVSTGGTLDEESCRDSIAQAMSDLIIIDPDVDFLNLDNNSIWIIIELFLANEAFNRLILDIGQLFESARYSPKDAVSRMNDIRDFLKSEISAQIQESRANTFNLTKDDMNTLLQSVVKNTFEVFEE